MPGLAIEERYVEAGGLPIRYLAAGEGPPLLLLHGAGDNALDRRWVRPDLAAANRVYAPDPPRSPGSARPATGYSPGFFERFVAAIRAQVGLRGQRELLVDRLPSLQMPVLVVWGARDRVLSESQGEDAATRLSEGRLEIIPDCGHLPHVEWPGSFVAALDGFLPAKVRP